MATTAFPELSEWGNCARRSPRQRAPISGFHSCASRAYSVGLPTSRVLWTAMPKKRVALLISGRGSNMQALIRAMREPGFPAEPVVVISNRPEALGLSWAKELGIPAVAIDHRPFANRMAFEARLHQTLLEHGTELICNAGFMRLLTGSFVDRWHDRQLNIHPSLLPAFPGLDTHQRVLDSGALITGCTVHFVRLEIGF